MTQKRPDWRWLEIQEAVKAVSPPSDEFLRDIYNVILGELDHETYKYVLEMYMEGTQRDTLVAWFLSGANIEQIIQGSGVVEDALKVFERLFVDPEAFRNKMEWRAYAEYYALNCCANENGQKQIKMGVLEGPIPLLAFWKRGNELIKITDTEIMSQEAILAYVKSLAARNASILDPEAKEALRWGQFAVSSAARRNILNDTSEVEVDAIVAIRKRRATVDSLDIGLSLDEIGH